MFVLLFTLVIVGVGYAIITNWHKEVTYKQEPSPLKQYNEPSPPKLTIVKEEVYYESHCWNCKSGINSRSNQKCKKCNQYFICKNCGMCYCDYGKVEKNKLQGKKTWQLKEVKGKDNRNNGYKVSKYGYCKKCGKKLRGDISKPLCYECYTNK